jgi:UDP-2-acetamido-3-amino-2,3-dideoxy-glucuronate N-acetyltransferase
MPGREGIRVAVIGAGYWGKNLVRNFHGLGVLDAICDSSGETLARFEESFPLARKASSVGEVLCDPRLHAVAIATPAATHAALARQALLAGKDVYVEKPLCLSEEEGRELNELAADRDAVLMVGHLLWYHPAVLKLKALVDGGKLGRIQYIYSSRLNLGKLRREENVLWSFAPHDISVILGLLGEMPESVQAQGGRFLHQKIADTTVTLLSFPSGVQAHIFVSWLHPFKEQKLVVVGEQAMAVFDDTAPWTRKLEVYSHSIEWKGNVPTANRAAGVPIELVEEEPLKLECEHFLSCVVERRAPRTDGREGLRVLSVLNACQRAMEEGAATRLEPLERRYFAHETAVIDRGAKIGDGSRIWCFSHILSGSEIGAGCVVGQNACIGPEVRIGNGCKIQNNVSIYKGVTLEDRVFCGPSMVFTNVHNPRAAISRMDEVRRTLVREGCTIGANATVLCGHTLGRYSFIGAGAVVTRDVPDHALVFGNPAKVIGWVCACGTRLDDALRCGACGKGYVRRENGVAAV